MTFKLTTFVLSLSFICSGFAASIEEAQDHFSRRGESLDEASKAAEIYLELANAESNALTKGMLYSKASDATYFVAARQGSDKEKEAGHKKGFELADLGIKTIEATNDQSEKAKDILADAYYNYGANLGKWGEAKGVATSIGQWPTLKEKMEYILNVLKRPETRHFGALRILGRAYYKIPAILGGSDKKSEKYLEKAYQGTLNSEGVSTHGLNVVYYAETLNKLGKGDLAKSVLKKYIDFIDQNGAEKLEPNRVPETLEEVEIARKVLSDL